VRLTVVVFSAWLARLGVVAQGAEVEVRAGQATESMTAELAGTAMIADESRMQPRQRPHQGKERPRRPAVDDALEVLLEAPGVDVEGVHHRTERGERDAARQLRLTRVERDEISHAPHILRLIQFT
jgi:hypothetical protein